MIDTGYETVELSRSERQAADVVPWVGGPEPVRAPLEQQRIARCPTCGRAR